jgi:serine/threonine-protein kinase
MEAVILRALAKNPDDRYPSAAAMLEDIKIEGPPGAEKTAEVPRSGGSRKGLVLASTLASLVFLGGGTLASGLVSPPAYPGAGETLNRAAPVEVEAPPASPAPPENAAAPEELVAVPDVRTYFDYFAEERLAGRGFEVKFVYDYRDGYANRGVTWATDPAVGTLAPEGSTVTVYATPLDRPQPEF